MTNTPEKTPELRAVTAIRNAAVSDVKGQSLRATALGAMTEIDLLAHGIPQMDIIPVGEFTTWLKGDDDVPGDNGFNGILGFSGWAEMDADLKINQAMQDVMREVSFVAAAGVKKGWFCDKDGTSKEAAQITKAGEFYVIATRFGGYDEDAATVQRISFSKAYSAARKLFSKPSLTGDQPHDVAALKNVLLKLANKDGDYTLEELHADCIPLIKDVRDMIEELYLQGIESGAYPELLDVPAVSGL